jgi:hypothetical protein
VITLMVCAVILVCVFLCDVWIWLEQMALHSMGLSLVSNLGKIDYSVGSVDHMGDQPPHLQTHTPTHTHNHAPLC